LFYKEDGNVFVIGDAANFKDKNNNSLPGIAPVAIQQGKYLAKIIKNKILNKTENHSDTTTKA